MQDAAAALPDLRRHPVFGARRTAVLGVDLTSVCCNGTWLTLGVAVDDLMGLVLSVDILERSDAESIRTWLDPIVQAVGAEVVVRGAESDAGGSLVCPETVRQGAWRLDGDHPADC